MVGVLVNLTIDFGSEHAMGRLTALVALGAFGVEVAGQNVLWAVLGALVLGGFALRPASAMPGASPQASRAPASVSISWQRLLLAAVPGLVVVAGAVVAAAGPGPLAAVSAAMAKIGAVAFGNGTAIMPLLQQSAIEHQWLTLRQFGVGVGLGQITPGPFLSTAAFVGYGAAGWWGGIAGGLAIYAPSVAMTMVVAEIYPDFRRHLGSRGDHRSDGGLHRALGGHGARARSTGAVGPGSCRLGGSGVRRRSGAQVEHAGGFAAGLGVWVIYLVLGGSV